MQREGCKIVAHAIVEQDNIGKVSVKEPGQSSVCATVGAVVVGIAGKHLGRPIAEGHLKELGEALTPDSPAVPLLLEDIWSEDTIDRMSGYNANAVTLTVGDELPGQIAQYLADAITDEQGSVEVLA